MTPWKPGTRVVTLHDSGADDYYADAREQCQWNAQGTITAHSNGHGLCYCVRHFDGSSAWYEPNELQPVTENQP